MRIGCAAKLLTASLAWRAFAAGLLAPEDDVLDWLGTEVRTAALRGITLRHLLEHTHGLDDSRLEEVPRTATGFVDVERVVRAAIAHARIAPPGAVYSYGSCGAGLMAAVLERRMNEPYEVLVRAQLLAPLEIDERKGSASPGTAICPATGGGLALNAADLLRVLEQAALTDPGAWPGDDPSGTLGTITLLPGWNPLERGIYLGWKYCGRGWFGHQSVWPAASIFARVNPGRGIALVVMSRGQAAAIVAARLVGAALPELFDVRMPVRGTSVDFDDCVGRYASAAWSVDVESTPAGLELRARRRGERGARSERVPLRAAEGGLFFPQCAISDSFPYVQFVAPRHAACDRYLWNGRFVLRKLD